MKNWRIVEWDIQMMGLITKNRLYAFNFGSRPYIFYKQRFYDYIIWVYYYTQSIRPIQYPCLQSKLVYNFILKSGLALILILAKLLQNWQNKCFLFFYIKNTRFEPQIFVEHT